ncbi:MAG: PEP-CTERM sorting domain-containing protein [Oscillatoriales cyanobacterium C42_A2020_001]|nr:PEP-CTERM sorting domain-containing protein [Leptolyngbyaceae cyanobacterium C42_A2020_001]
MSFAGNLFAVTVLGVVSWGLTQPASAAVINFSQVIEGQTSFGFDGDGDGINDVIFSTTDPLGFLTTGPGPNQVFISEPGLEGTSLLDPDLRVDFLEGAAGSIRFGFALNSFTESANTFTAFQLFDSTGSLLASAQQAGIFGSTSTFPEGQIEVGFAGIAAYGLFNFSSDNGRYIIDNFDGTFGSTEDIDSAAVPEPMTIAGTGLAIAAATLLRKRQKRRYTKC